MKKKLSLILCSILFILCVGCNEKLKIEDTNVVNQLQEKIIYLTSTYYEKFENKTFTSDDVKEKLYVKVADGLKTAFNVKFGTVTFNKQDKIKFNIGNNSYIYAYAYYKIKQELYVFAPLLSIEGGMNKTLLFCVDKQYFSVKVYDGEYNKLEISDAKSLKDETNSSVKMEKNKADRDVITHTVSDIDTPLGVNLKVDSTEIPKGTILFIRKSYQKYTDPTEYIIYISDDDATIKLNHNDSKDNIKKGEERNIDVLVTRSGGGEIGFDLTIKYK